MRRLSLWPGGLILIALAVVVFTFVVPGSGSDRPRRVFVPAGESPPPGVPLPPFEQRELSFDPETWKYPLGYEAVEVASAEAGVLPFVPDVPDQLEKPSRIVASPLNEDPLLRRIAWIYDDPDLGTVILEEDIAFETQSELEEPATHDPGCTVIWNEDFTGYDVECHGAGFALVALESGQNALAIDGSGVSALQWIQPLEVTMPNLLEGQPKNAVLELQLFVEKDGLSPEELASIANKV